jgi:hypothetical protein
VLHLARLATVMEAGAVRPSMNPLP